MTTDRGGEDRAAPGGVVATRVVAGRRRSLAVPAILIVALAIAALGFLGQKTIPPEPPQPPDEPTPSPPALVAIDWAAIPIDPATFQGALVGLVVSSPAGILALGQDKTDRHPIAWTSADATTWVRTDLPPWTFGGGVPDAAALVGSLFVAIGYHATPDGTTRDVWTSPDGRDWSRDPSPTGRGFDHLMFFVASNGTAVLVAQLGGRQALLSSQDGLVWTEAADLDVVLGRDPYLGAVVDSGDGYVAVGSVGSDGAIWRSPDGASWSRATLADPTAAEDTRFDRVFRTAEGLLATGSRNGFGSSSDWRSDDGVTWTPDTTSALGSRTLLTVLDLEGGDFGVSDEAGFAGPGGLTVWTDPQDPQVVPPPTDAPTDWTRQAVALDGRILVLAQNATSDRIEGWFGTVANVPPDGLSPPPDAGSPTDGPAGPSPSEPPIVVRPPSASNNALDWSRLTSHRVLADDVRDVSIIGVVSLGPSVVAFGSVGSDAAIWTARDLGHWERAASFPRTAGAFVRGVAGGSRGRLVAVGAVQTVDGIEAPAAWVSPDGHAWVRATIPRVLGNGELSDVVAGPDGFVAVGWRDTEQGSMPAVWLSADGGTWTLAPGVPDAVPGMIQGIVHGTSGYVAVGSSQPAGSMIGAAWTSPDGRTWSIVTDQAAFAPPPESAGQGGVSISDVAVGGPGFVAVGSLDGAFGPSGAVFTSRDGRDWVRLAPDPVFDGAFPRTVAPWAGGLAIAGDRFRFAGVSPALWTSRDGTIWTRSPIAEFATDRHDRHADSTLDGVAGYGRDLIGVGSAGATPDHLEGVIWVGAPAGEIVPDHVCPDRVDSVVVLASMSAADRAGCITDPRGVTVTALARAGDGGCTSEGTPDELSGCGGFLELGAPDGGPVLLTMPIDRALLTAFPSSAFSPLVLTVRTGLAGPACVAQRSPNGVSYEAADGTRLQCLAVLRLLDWRHATGP